MFYSWMLLFSLSAKAIDEYAILRSKAVESSEVVEIDPRLVAIVERMLDKYGMQNLFIYVCLQVFRFSLHGFLFYRCITDGKYQQAMGIAIECRRLDKLEEAIIKSENVQGTLSYCINVSHSFVNQREYRHEVSLVATKLDFNRCIMLMIL